MRTTDLSILKGIVQPKMVILSLFIGVFVHTIKGLDIVLDPINGQKNSSKYLLMYSTVVIQVIQVWDDK